MYFYNFLYFSVWQFDNWPRYKKPTHLGQIISPTASRMSINVSACCGTQWGVPFPKERTSHKDRASRLSQQSTASEGSQPGRQALVRRVPQVRWQVPLARRQVPWGHGGVGGMALGSGRLAKAFKRRCWMAGGGGRALWRRGKQQQKIKYTKKTYKIYIYIYLHFIYIYIYVTFILYIYMYKKNTRNYLQILKRHFTQEEVEWKMAWAIACAHQQRYQQSGGTCRLLHFDTL